MTLPNFLVVGAARCGTTSLHYYLAQHPDICMSDVKEPNFFLFDQTGDRRPFVADRRIIGKSIADRHAYERLFSSPSASAVGEASPLYLYVEETPALIAGILPDARIIAVLRDPVDRAWSHFRYVTGMPAGEASSAFLEAARVELPLPDEPYRTGTHYLRLGRYARQLQRYVDGFGRDAVMCLSYDDLVGSPNAVLAEVCRFLGIDDAFAFDTGVRWNPGSVSSRGALDRFVAPLLPRLKRSLPATIVGPAARLRARRRAGRAGAAAETPAAAYELTDGYFADDIAWVRSSFGLDLARPSRGGESAG